MTAPDNPELQQRLAQLQRAQQARSVRNTFIALVVLAAVGFAVGFAARYFQG